MAKIEEMKVEVQVEAVETGTVRIKKESVIIIGASMGIVCFLAAVIGASIGDIIRFFLGA